MFSMKYTSPKVTPKKGALPPTPSDASPSPAASACAPSAADRTICKNLALGFIGEDDIVFSLTKHSKRTNGVYRASDVATRRSSSTLAKAILSNGRRGGEFSAANVSLMSENDSSVANVSEEGVAVEPPRSNLLSLLDREYAKGSSSGEGSSKNTLRSEERSSGDKDDVEPAATDSITEENSAIADDENDAEGDDAEWDRKDAAADARNTINLSEGYSLHETAEGSFEYLRSSSMEPLVEEGRPGEPSAPSVARATSSAAEEESVEVTPLVGQTGSGLRIPYALGSGVTLPNDARSVSPIIERPEYRSPGSPPTIYDMSAQPASPIVSEVNADGLGGEPTRNGDSPARSATTESEIGGDTYFDEPIALRPREKKPRADSVDSDSMAHVPLPPRVNRTTSAPFLPTCPSTPTHSIAMAAPIASPIFPKQSPLPQHHPFSPRQPFSHTHSLLDDCSDEEDETTSFRIVDSPTRHMSSSYSCLPRPRASTEGGGRASPFSSYFKNKSERPRRGARRGRSSVPSACRVSNDIQQALLQTRHRRWDCQSAYAGAHAQPSAVLDLSRRAHNVNGDGEAARLSVSAESVRAAALAAGLWRTVRLVRLPAGLFWRRRLAAGRDGRPEGEEEVWALLRTLHSTFPSISQIDFGGDISRAMGDSNRESGNGDDWRDEIVSCIMECLPNIVAIDGFVVEQDAKAPASSEETGRRSDASSNITSSSSHDRQAETNAVESAAACVECESVPMCGLSEFVDSETQLRLNASTGTMSDGDLNDVTLSPYRVDASNHAEEITTLTGPSKCAEDASENITSTEETSAINDDPWHEFTDDEMRKVPTLSSSSSMLSSSRSWGSNGSGTRPPTCPTSSSSRQRSLRLPTKPVDRKSTKGSFMKAGAGLKRRVLGLIPSVSMMDEDDDDEDSDDSDKVAEKDCPTDLL